MPLPSFEPLFEAHCAANKILNDSKPKDPGYPMYFGGRSRIDQTRRRKPPYASDGICGLVFGNPKPAFAEPIHICCEKLYFTEYAYQRHVAKHVLCPGLPGVENSSCGKMIHKKSIKVHLEIDPFHRKKTKVDELVEQDEDLKRWREERKKRYPTFARFQAQMREVGYRMQTGTIFVTRQFGSLNKRNPPELRPIPEKTIKRFKPADENEDALNETPNEQVTAMDTDPPINPDEPDEKEPIDEDEKVLSDSDDDDEVVKIDDETKEEVESEGEKDVEDDKDDSEESDSEEEVVDEIETPKVTQKEQPPGYANYDSDRSWSDGPAEDEKDEVKPPSDKISKLITIVDYESSSEEEVVPDAGDAELTPHFLPPKELSLIDQLKFFKPQNSEDDEKTEGKASEEKPEEERKPKENQKFRNRRGGRGRNRFGRGNRSNRGRNARGRQNQDDNNNIIDDDDDEFLKLSAAEEAKLALDFDETSMKKGTNAFTSHPIVEMARKRRLCMRKVSTMHKRPTLLHMLLAEEIRHERNQLMQCVRFVVNNNFFLPENK